MDSLKITLIYELGPTDDGSFLGGIESHILGLARQLAKSNEVTLLTGMIPGAKRETQMNDFHLLRSDFLGLVQRAWDPTNLTSARQVFSIPSFLKAGRKITSDIYHGHIYASGLVALALSQGGRGHAVNTIHGSYYDHWDTITGSSLKSMGYRTAERILATYLARHCDRQIHTATDFAEKVRRWGGRGGRIRVILNGVDTGKFSSRVDPSTEDSGRPIVMTVRRLVPKNGVRFFVEALCHVKSEVDFVIVGDGPERQNLEELAKRLGVSGNVQLLGAVPNDALPAVMSSAHIVVVPSLVEASSISLLEAMAMEKPTIVTDIPGIDEVASPERSVMVPPARPKEIAAAVDLLLSSPSLCRRLGRRGRSYVTSQRSEEVVARETMRVYREALEV